MERYMDDESPGTTAVIIDLAAQVADLQEFAVAVLRLIPSRSEYLTLLDALEAAPAAGSDALAAAERLRLVDLCGIWPDAPL